MSIYYITNNSIDNFNTIGKLEYMGIEDYILSEQELKEQNKVELYKDTTIFEGDNLFKGYPIRVGSTIRPATVVELIKMNLQELRDGEYIEGDELKEVQKPSYRHNIWDKNTHTWLVNEELLKDGEYIENEEIKTIYKQSGMCMPVWNKELHIWEEGATENEIALSESKKQISEYKILDTPLSFELMEERGILVEYKSFMKYLYKVVDSIEQSALSGRVTFALDIPKPSKLLSDFKDRFNKFFK